MNISKLILLYVYTAFVVDDNYERRVKQGKLQMTGELTSNKSIVGYD